MTAPIKTKEELTRMAWLVELRRQGHRQCEGAYFIGHNACALGLLIEVAGFDRSDRFLADPDRVGVFAGLNEGEVDAVISMNDGIGDRKHTFAEIADVVEGWFR